MIEVGHVISGDVGSKLEFRISSNANISVGDFVIIKDKHMEHENYFVGRIINIKLKTLGRDDFLADMSAQIEASPQDVDPFEFRQTRSEALARIAEVSLIGILNGKSISPPKKIPNHLSPVYIPTVEQMDWITTKGDVTVGKLRAEMSGEGFIPIKLNSEVLIRKHLFVAAMTGSGKTVAVKTIIKELYKLNNCGILIFDTHGEYSYSSENTRGLKELGDDDVIIYGLNNKADKRLKLNYKDISLVDLYYFYDWSSAQKEALGILFSNMGHEMLDYMKDAEPVDIKKEFGINIETANVLIRRIRQILNDSFDFVTQRNVPRLFDMIISDLQKKKIVIIDFARLSERSENILINILSKRILYHNKIKTQGGLNPTNIFVVLEEAQRFLDPAEHREKGVMRELVREGRKFGVGLGAITQIPRFFDERILSQFNTYIILKLANAKDRDILEGGSPQNISDMFTEIATLYPGEAVVVGEAIPLALPVKVDYFDRLDLSEVVRKSDDKEKEKTVFIG